MGSLGDFDAAALQHALTVIDDWDIDAASLLDEHDDGGNVKPPVSPSTTKRARPTAPYSQRCHGTTLKRELLRLRAHVESLQRDLVNVQHTDWVQPLENTASEAAALQRECRGMATRQYRARLIAEMRNKDLRKLVDGLRRDAVKIERLGRRMLSLKRTFPRHASFPIATFDGPREAPQLQLSRLPGLAQEAATIFARGAFAEHSHDRLKVFREVALHDTRLSTGLVEAVFETAWVLPFDVDDVARALWFQTTRVTTGTNDIQWLDVHVDNASVVSQFVSVATDDISRSIKCGQIASHRDRLSDGVVQLVSNVQVQTKGDSARVGLYCSDVWVRVQTISQAGNCPLSQVLWCRRVRLQPPASHSQTLHERTQWMHKVLAGYTGSLRAREESMLSCNMQAVENHLVSASVRRTELP